MTKERQPRSIESKITSFRLPRDTILKIALLSVADDMQKQEVVKIAVDKFAKFHRRYVRKELNRLLAEL